MDLFAVVVLAILIWIAIAGVALALCRIAAQSDAANERLHQALGTG